MVSPFLRKYIIYSIRVMIIIGLTTISLLMVAFAPHVGVAIVGVGLTSCSTGLGESTFLAYTAIYNKYVYTL